MLNYDRKYNSIHDEFERMFPLIAQRVISWWPGGRGKIVLAINDGSRIIYDGVRHSMWNARDTRGNDEDEWRRYFAFKLEDVMLLNNVSSKELSERVGISTQMISRYLNRKSTPSPFIVQKIARALNTTSAELIEFPDVEWHA